MTGYDRDMRNNNYQEHSRYGLRPPNSYNTPGQSNNNDFFSSLKSMFGVGESSSVRPSVRRYDGNPYSKLRERNKRDADNKGWRGQITRAPYNNAFEFPYYAESDSVTPAPGHNQNQWSNRPEQSRDQYHLRGGHYQKHDGRAGQHRRQFNYNNNNNNNMNMMSNNDPPPKVLPVGQGCQVTYLGRHWYTFDTESHDLRQVRNWDCSSLVASSAMVEE